MRFEGSGSGANPKEEKKEEDDEEDCPEIASECDLEEDEMSEGVNIDLKQR